MFRSVGQVLHLLQDASQPQHVRNEQHLPGLWQSPIEKYGADHYQQLNYQQSTLDWRGLGFRRMEDFWSTHLYQGAAYALDADANGGPTLGLAEFCNGNFIGERHSFPEYFRQGSVDYYPYPSRNSSTTYNSVKANPASGIDSFTNDSGRLCKGIYLSKIADGINVTHLARVNYLGAKIPGLAGKVYCTIDDPNVLLDYHAILLPKAVEYSAGLLDYYFRGRLSVSVSGLSGSTDSLQITNASSQDLSGGAFRLFFDDANGKRSEITAPDFSTTYTGALAPGGSINGTLNVPANATNCVLVYQGTIGTTNNSADDPVDNGIAIAAGKFTPLLPNDFMSVEMLAPWNGLDSFVADNSACQPAPEGEGPYCGPPSGEWFTYTDFDCMTRYLVSTYAITVSGICWGDGSGGTLGPYTASESVVTTWDADKADLNQLIEAGANGGGAILQQTFASCFASGNTPISGWQWSDDCNFDDNPAPTDPNAVDWTTIDFPCGDGNQPAHTGSLHGLFSPPSTGGGYPAPTQGCGECSHTKTMQAQQFCDVYPTTPANACAGQSLCVEFKNVLSSPWRYADVQAHAQSVLSSIHFPSAGAPVKVACVTVDSLNSPASCPIATEQVWFGYASDLAALPSDGVRRTNRLQYRLMMTASGLAWVLVGLDYNNTGGYGGSWTLVGVHPFSELEGSQADDESSANINDYQQMQDAPPVCAVAFQSDPHYVCEPGAANRGDSMNRFGVVLKKSKVRVAQPILRVARRTYTSAESGVAADAPVCSMTATAAKAAPLGGATLGPGEYIFDPGGETDPGVLQTFKGTGTYEDRVVFMAGDTIPTLEAAVCAGP